MSEKTPVNGVPLPTRRWRQAALEREAYEAAVDQADPLDALARLAEFIGTVSCMPCVRRCAFINAAAETPDPDDPVRIVVDSQRRWTHDLFAAGHHAVHGDPGRDGLR
ncbi:hypothetical protein [Cellulomonas dongxiuzhuiae]|uniref:4Fe-4S Wbl-type domain-containing protein n=1 Tax=Cellulomonas dongxiuzhuiae TaxID=2819979 RepID=A0ABX8GJM9_9CELL|nr:hypothetical protein [Cellulomonas dongxiuzhuiae]MBO3094411.1 hypothetical protein [Cellulomonas dongxiuzhuiae]QWC15439.1 hypothetical protein KKR89_14205 [Cellulomonas dongxiuzhuiae]